MDYFIVALFQHPLFLTVQKNSRYAAESNTI